MLELGERRRSKGEGQLLAIREQCNGKMRHLRSGCCSESRIEGAKREVGARELHIRACEAEIVGRRDTDWERGVQQEACMTTGFRFRDNWPPASS